MSHSISPGLRPVPGGVGKIMIKFIIILFKKIIMENYKNLWETEYPLNILKQGFNYKQNYKRIKLLEKLGNLNNDYIKEIGDLDAPFEVRRFNLTRKKDKCCVVPVWGNGIFDDKCGKLPEKILQKLYKYGIKTFNFPRCYNSSEKELFITDLHKSGNLPIEPKNGDIFILVNCLIDPACENTFYYYENTFNVGYNRGCISSCVEMTWPDIPLDYWSIFESWNVFDQFPIPREYFEDFVKNYTFDYFPIAPNTNLKHKKYLYLTEKTHYSWIEKNEKILYIMCKRPFFKTKLTKKQFRQCLEYSILKFYFYENCHMVLFEKCVYKTQPLYECDCLLLDECSLHMELEILARNDELERNK